MRIGSAGRLAGGGSGQTGVKPGQGSLSVDGVALTVKGAKPLPSSD